MSHDEIVIKKLAESDLDELRELSIDTFYEAFIWGNSEPNMQYYISHFFSREKLAKELADPNSSFYFARLHGRAIGYLKLNEGTSQTDMRSGNGIEVERIYVHKDHRSHGIGQLLFNKAMDIAREKKAGFLWLGVWEKNPAAIRFYERNGLRQFGSHSFMLGDDKQTDLMMKIELGTPA